MRNIAEIVKDDRNGKQLSQTERQIATAYTQGKCDAAKKFKAINNSNINEVLDKIRAEVEQLSITDTAIKLVTEVLDRYKAESEGKK